MYQVSHTNDALTHISRGRLTPSPGVAALFGTEPPSAVALATAEHRLKALREISSARLLGQSLVVLDPSLMLVVDVFPCVDGHALERSII